MEICNLSFWIKTNMQSMQMHKLLINETPNPKINEPKLSGVARGAGGGAARPGCHHFGVTPYYDVKPYITPPICIKYLFFFSLFRRSHPHLD